MDYPKMNLGEENKKFDKFKRLLDKFILYIFDKPGLYFLYDLVFIIFYYSPFN